MKPDEDGWVYFGQHSTRFEPPDLVYFRPVGHASFEEVEAIVGWCEGCVKENQRIYLLTDLARGTSQSADIIKSKDLMERVRVFRALSYFGTTFRARTGIGIYMRVARFFNLPLADLPLAFFSNEQEARAWIDRHRVNALSTSPSDAQK